MPNQAAKGLLRGVSADILGAPVDAATMLTNGLLATGGYLGHKAGLLSMPPELIDPASVPGSSDWLAKKSGLEGEGLAYEAGRIVPGLLPIAGAAGKAGLAKALEAAASRSAAASERGAIRVGGDPNLFLSRNMSGFPIQMHILDPRKPFELRSPSFGVTKGALMEGFGDVTLLPREGKFDPATDYAVLYNRDAWTPTLGDASVPISYKKAKDLALTRAKERIPSKKELSDPGAAAEVLAGARKLINPETGKPDTSQEARIWANLSGMADKIDIDQESMYGVWQALNRRKAVQEAGPFDFIPESPGKALEAAADRAEKLLSKPQIEFLLKYGYTTRKNPMALTQDEYANFQKTLRESLMEALRERSTAFNRGWLSDRMSTGSPGDPIEEMAILKSPYFRSFREFERSKKGAGLLTPNREFSGKYEEMTESVGPKDPIRKWSEVARQLPSSYAELKVQRNPLLTGELFAGAIIPKAKEAGYRKLLDYFTEQKIPWVISSEQPGLRTPEADRALAELLQERSRQLHGVVKKK